MKNYRVFVVNPGSTSTKVALFEGEQTLFEANVSHDAAELAKFVQVKDQLPYRIQAIEQALAEKGTVLEHIDACVGRGGGLLPIAGGTYKETPLLLEHSVSGANGVQHPAMLGSSIAKHLADKLGCFSKDVLQWESGKREPKLSTGVKIAQILGISAEEIAAFYENYGKNEN